MILKVPWQILVHVILGYWDVQVGVQVARVLWKKPEVTLSKTASLDCLHEI